MGTMATSTHTPNAHKDITLYDPQNNPVAADAPGWLACTTDHKGLPLSANGPTADRALSNLAEAAGWDLVHGTSR